MRCRDRPVTVVGMTLVHPSRPLSLLARAVCVSVALAVVSACSSASGQTPATVPVSGPSSPDPTTPSGPGPDVETAPAASDAGDAVDAARSVVELVAATNPDPSLDDMRAAAAELAVEGLSVHLDVPGDVDGDGIVAQRYTVVLDGVQACVEVPGEPGRSGVVAAGACPLVTPW